MQWFSGLLYSVITKLCTNISQEYTGETEDEKNYFPARHW